MALSMYEASAPVFVRALKVLKALLEKGEASGVPAPDLVEARLAPDMLTLAGQIQRASDSSKLAVARLAGVEAPPMADQETTLEALKDRIDRTIAFIETVPQEAFQGAEDRDIEFKAGPNVMQFTGKSYLLTFAIPNFFFHVTTAYALLRNKGVQIGKLDFLRPPA